MSQAHSIEEIMHMKRHVDVHQRKMERLGWGFSAPAFIVIAAVTLFPIVYSVIMSLNNVQVTGNGVQLQGFSLDNYQKVFTSSAWRQALFFTLLYTVVTVFFEMILGTAFALVLEKMVKGRGWMMAILLIPWSLITVISAELWGYIYDPTYGALTYIFNALHIPNPVYLGTPSSAITAMMIADIWKTTPFVAIIVVAGLVMIPHDVYEAAALDGSSAWKTFWRITVPMLRPTILLALLFRILQAFGLFDLPFVLTGGGPNGSTTSLAVLAYKTMFNSLHFGTGSAIATTTALVVIVCCLIFMRVFKSQVSDTEA